MAKTRKQYKCYLCGKLIGFSKDDRLNHMLEHHKSILKEKQMDIHHAILIYTKLNDYKDAPIDVTRPKAKKDINSRIKGVNTRKNRLKMAHTLKGLRGTEVTTLHRCSCCGKLSTHNWEYHSPNNITHYLCLTCHQQVKFPNPKPEIIYNPVATNRRKH